MNSNARPDSAASSCPKPRELAAFDCGDLPARTAEQMTAHVQSCETCLVQHISLDDESDEIRQALTGPTAHAVDATRYVNENEYVQLRNNLLINPEPVADSSLLDDAMGTVAQLPLPRKLPFRLGSYQLLEKIGQGAMGAVYRAEHLSLKRIVAIKLLAPGRLSQADALARFRREMEAIGRLNHPHIVTAHDAGEVDGCHFLVTEYVEGFDLSTLVDRLGPLSIADACELVRQAALGLQCAHQQGMLHQDIKPSNLMVTPEGHVKVLDLGLVSFMSETVDDQQADEIHMGTPDYMAPERWLNSRRIDTRADVYSLGCTLFKLLVGHAPFSQRLQTVDEKAHRHVSMAVPSLRQARDDVPTTLERAVCRMLAKSPDDRYRTPAEVAQVLGAYAHGADLAAVVSRADTAPSQPQQTLRTTPRADASSSRIRRRVRLLVTAAAAAFFCGLVIYAVTNKGTMVVDVHQDDVKVTLDHESILIKSPRDELHVWAGDHVLQVEKEGFVTETHKFVMARGGKREFDVTLQASPGVTPPKHVAPAIGLTVSQPPLHDTIPPLAHLKGHTDSVPCVTVSPDATRVLSASVDKTIRLWDLESQEEIRRFVGHTNKVVCAVFSPDATRIASASHDGTVRLWDVDTGEETHRLQGHRGWVNRVDFSPDGRLLISAGEDGLVRIWDSSTGNLEQSLAGHTSWIRSVAFSPDGQSVISCGNDATAILWDLARGRMKRVYQGHSHVVTHALVSSDQRHVLSGSLDHTAVLWDLETQQPLRVLSGHQDTLFAVALLPGYQHAITASADHTLALWNMASGRKLTTFSGHAGYVLSVSVSPDGRFFVSSSQDRTVRVWPVPLLPESTAAPVKSDRIASPSNSVEVETSTVQTWSAHKGGVNGVKWTDDGNHVVSGGEDQMVRMWNVADGKQMWSAAQDDHVTSIALSHDSTVSASGDKSGTIVLRELDSGRERLRLEGHTGWISSLDFAEDDRELVSGSFDKTLRRWDVQSGEELQQFGGYAAWIREAVFDAQANRVLCAGNQGVVVRVDPDGQADRMYGKLRTGHVLATLRISPDQQLVAAAGWTQTIRLWNRDNGAEGTSCDGHLAAITEIDFTPDGAHIVSASYDQSVRLWNAASREEVRRYLGHQGPVRCVAVSPDGRFAVSGSTDGTLRVWQLAE